MKRHPNLKQYLRKLFSALAIAGTLLGLPSADAATITVTNNRDSGPGSLRQALADAHNEDAINFDPFNGNQSSLALFVYQQAGDASKYAPARAWTAALTLVALVLILTIAAKMLARRNSLTR